MSILLVETKGFALFHLFTNIEKRYNEKKVHFTRGKRRHINLFIVAQLIWFFAGWGGSHP